MRWLKKREFLSFFILSERFSGVKADYYDMLFFLEKNMFFSRRVARNVLKRLIKMGYIKRNNDGYFIRSVKDVLDEYYFMFFTRRLSKSGGLRHSSS